jgi:adenine specific DNA methylase Mod
MEHYIAWLKERVEQMHRILKPSGSIFLHCDWHANAYIRCQILDKIFGENNFVNEIIWQKIRTTKAQSKQFGNVHDVIYFYSKSVNWFFENQYKNFDQKYIKSHYKTDEKTGKQYRTVSMLQQGQGTAKKFGDKILEPPAGKHWIWSQERIDQAMNDGLIRFTSNGRPEKIQFLEDMKGDIVDDMWEDIVPVNSQAKERIGYPTQKPEALLERIINCASNEGDIVLDPFMGGGTTVAVADKLNRKWLGIDQSVQAVKVTELRLNKQQDLFSAPFSVQLHKYDYDTLRYKNAFEFEEWIVQQF